MSEKHYEEGRNSCGLPGDQETYYNLEVTTHLTHLGPAMIERCMRTGLVRPVQNESEAWRYSSSDVVRLRKVRRLIQELGLNWAGVEIVMRLTDEMEQLRAELERLRRL